MLDKKRDSGAIVKLVEQLRQAILIYKVCIADSCRSSRVDAFRIVVATAVYRESGHTIGCMSPSSVFTFVSTDRQLIESSHLSAHF